MLQDLLALDIFHVALVFTRMSGAFLSMPGFSANYVPIRIRLFMALGVSVALLPAALPILPDKPPESAALLVGMMVVEMTIGVFMGVVTQFLLTAMHFAGSVVALSAGLANAFIFDPVSESQGAMVTGFFNLVALIVIFVTGTHLLMLEAVMETYTLFPVGQGLVLGDMANYLAETLGHSFYIGLRLASPFVVFSITFQTAMGVTARLMPQMNVFFVALPMQILLALALISLVLPTILLWLMNHYESGLRGFIAGG
jgi:flagellar biosynthetic protein FliR